MLNQVLNPAKWTCTDEQHKQLTWYAAAMRHTQNQPCKRNMQAVSGHVTVECMHWVAVGRSGKASYLQPQEPNVAIFPAAHQAQDDHSSLFTLHIYAHMLAHSDCYFCDSTHRSFIIGMLLPNSLLSGCFSLYTASWDSSAAHVS
jgi:hypothetical protein